MNQSRSLSAALIDIHVDPKKALRTVEEGRRHWTWLPLILVLICPIAITGYYFATVDIAWLADTMLASAGTDVPPEAAQYMTRTMMMVSTFVSQTIVILLILGLMALYLHLVARVMTVDGHSYGKWFRLVVWASIPASVIASLAMAVNYLASGTDQMTPTQLNFFSANALITKIPAGMSGASMMETITPFTLWTIGLLALGISLWSRRSYGTSLLIALAPYIVIYGIWALLSFG